MKMNGYVKESVKFLKNNKLLIILLFLVLFNTIFFFQLWKDRYYKFYTGELDIAFENNYLYNLVNGNFDKLMRTSLRGSLGLLNPHIQPAVLLLSPFYFLFPSVHTLFFFQVFLISIGALPIFLLAREKLKSEKLAFLLSVTYFILPLTQILLRIKFKAAFLAIPFLLFTFYFYEKKNFKFFLIFLTLSVLVKQNIAPISIMLGLLLLFKKEERKWWLFPIVLGLADLVLYILIMHGLLWIEPVTHSIEVNLGMTFNELILGMVRNPISFIKTHLMKENIFLYFKNLFSSFAFLPLLAPEILFIALPKLLENSITTKILIIAEENIIIFPLFLVSLVYSLNRIKKIGKKFLRNSNIVILLVILVLMGSSFLFLIRNDYIFELYKDSSYGLSPLCNTTQKEYDERFNELLKIEEMIPKDAFLLTDVSVILPFSSRKNINLHPVFSKPTLKRFDYLLFNEVLINCLKEKEEELKRFSRIKKLAEINLTSYLYNENYEIVYRKKGFLLLKTKTKSDNLLFELKTLK